MPDFPGDVDDATSLELPGAQQKLLDAVIETGKPVNVVISSGRPYNLGGVENRIAAQVMTFFSGQDICNFWRI
ncbi:glycoside hydrolase family 3 C-terminal domain-containing protein [Martelella mediterranea]|uniref:Glycosyl hydrolase family 3 n=1 Tax=Martelella mediterranea TaxID=293089 RepID=A0A4R3NSB8_9HYPH|nr:glycoside hydrolase family 3 C-terminal domain-containing protein [Martelella mediterranea]TCT39057.1 glycosyl hydrolase family 3 [Martelella mediterranea]